MARGRHAKPSGLLSRLFPGRAARRRTALEAERRLLGELRFEVDRLSRIGIGLAAQAAEAAARAQRAEEQALAARAEVEDLRAETGSLRTEVARLREEMLWAWAEGRLPVVAAPAEREGKVIDLREATGS